MKTWVRVALLVLLAGGVAILARVTPLGAELERLARALGEAADRPWAAPAYVALYAAALSVGLPGTLMTIIGGVAFGFWRGAAINLVGALVGAALGFVTARLLGRDLVMKRWGRYVARLERVTAPRAAFLTFLRLRLIPIVPYHAVNLAAGLTGVGLAPFLAGTFVGIVPSTTLYTYFAGALAEGGGARADAVWRIVAALLGILALTFIPAGVRLARRRIGRAHDASETSA